MGQAVLEQRTLTIRDVSTDDGTMKVAGYVNKNGSISEVLSEDGVVFQETILPQAFTNALAKGDEICFYLEHDPNKILATTKNNTLEVTQDNTGLHMAATIVPTSDGQNAYKLIKSGIITNMSFGFLVNEDVWDTDSDIPLRTVTDLDLLEVSAVKNPAYTSSTISARSKNEELLDKSKINFRDKGGVRAMELKNFSMDELKSEIEKRAKNTVTEKRDDSTVAPSDNGRLTDQDWACLLQGCYTMCNIMMEAMSGMPGMQTDSMPGMDMSNRSKENRDDATMTTGDNVSTDSKPNPNKAKDDTDNDGIGEERDDGDDDDVETDSKEATKSSKRDDDGDDVETDSKDAKKGEKRDDDDDDSGDDDDDTETDSKETPKGEHRSLDDMKDVLANMKSLIDAQF